MIKNYQDSDGCPQTSIHRLSQCLTGEPVSTASQGVFSNRLHGSSCFIETLPAPKTRVTETTKREIRLEMLEIPSTHL